MQYLFNLWLQTMYNIYILILILKLLKLIQPMIHLSIKVSWFLISPLNRNFNKFISIYYLQVKLPPEKFHLNTHLTVTGDFILNLFKRRALLSNWVSYRYFFLLYEWYTVVQYNAPFKSNVEEIGPNFALSIQNMYQF